MPTTIKGLPPESPAFEAIRVPARRATVSVIKPTRSYITGGGATGDLLVSMEGGEARLTLTTRDAGGVAGLSLTRESAAAVITALRDVYPTLR